MNLFIAQHMALPLFDLLKSSSVRRHFVEFSKFKYKSHDQIKAYQLNKLKRLLVHAYETVPFYQKRMKASGFNPYLISSLDQLDKLPCLTRHDLQNSSDDLFSTRVKKDKLIKGASSGSTGIPVVYYKDIIASSAGQAANMIGWGLAGWQLGDKGLHIWGNPTTVNNEWKRISSKMKALLYNHHKFAAYKLTEEKRFSELVELLRRKKYVFLDGYTNAIFLLASYIKDHNIKIKKFKYILPTGENLFDYQRDLIKEVLGPVYDMYGCSEINGIANECSHCGNYHIIDPHAIVEFGKTVNDEGARELIITDLDNFSFPMICYQNDDLAIPLKNSSSCQRIPFTSFKTIVGRQSDIIELPNGGKLSVPSFFGSMLLKQINGIKQYQIERTSPSHLRINLVVNNEFSSLDQVLIDKAMDDYLGAKMSWDIKILDTIPVSKNGKFKLLVDKASVSKKNL